MATSREVVLSFFNRSNIELASGIEGLMFHDTSTEHRQNIDYTPGGACVAIPFYKLSDRKFEHPQKMLRVWKGIKPLQPSLEYRCEKVNLYLSEKGLPCFVDSKYYSSVLNVGGVILSGSLMEYVEGKDLIDYLKDCISKSDCKSRLDILAIKFRNMCVDLKKAEISHGDMSGTNIRISKEGEIRLIDYDSICIPELVGKVYSTSGSDGFNHPQRKRINMQLNADYFPEIVIYLTILMLRDKPQLWADYVENKGDEDDDGGEDGGILFDSIMLRDSNKLKGSRLYKECVELGKIDPEINLVLEILTKSISANFDDVPFLFDILPVSKIYPQKVSPVMAAWCGVCGHHFENQTDKYCPTCGNRRELL